MVLRVFSHCFKFFIGSGKIHNVNFIQARAVRNVPAMPLSTPAGNGFLLQCQHQHQNFPLSYRSPLSRRKKHGGPQVHVLPNRISKIRHLSSSKFSCSSCMWPYNTTCSLGASRNFNSQAFWGTCSRGTRVCQFRHVGVWCEVSALYGDIFRQLLIQA